jgi:hypothetical protein
MEFFNNKNNESLKFKINSEGIDLENIEPRLILITKENKNYLFIGKVNNGICKFDIPELENFKKGDTGLIKFEIISEDLYFPVWKDEFEIKTKVNIKVEEMISQIINEEPKKKIGVNAILEKNETPIKKENTVKVEPKKPEIENQKIEEKESIHIERFSDWTKK